MQTFDIQAFVLSLLAAGAPALVISGWISNKLTHLDGAAMLVQSLVVAIAITFLEAAAGVIGIPPGAVWQWLVAGLTNGVIAAILYKLGVFNSFLDKIGALTAHQKEQA
jgi:hypothetical protein